MAQFVNSITAQDSNTDIKLTHTSRIKNKNTKSSKNRPMYLAAFLVPLGLMWLIYIAMEVWPFGQNSVLVLDLNGQYVYFFEELRNKLTSGGSLLYSWSRSLGGEFMGIFAYYIASPFSILTLLFPKSMITEALLAIILLKVGSCGLIMSVYLSKSHPGPRINTVIFSTMYAVCSYAVVQAHNTMWIDEMIFLPLMVLGIEQLITKRRLILFTASIALSAMVNFYIGYMMCIFVVLYFFYYYFAHNTDYENNFYEEDRHFIKSTARAAVCGIIGLAIAMAVLYPAYVSLTFGKTEFSDPSYTFDQKFDFLDMIAKLLPGSYDTVRPEGLPFIYSGTLTLILLPIYFISSNVKPREKIFSGLLASVLIFSFNASVVDMAWHGFQKPNWLNYRYSFIFCFFIIVLAYKAFADLERVDFRYILIVCGVWGILIFIIQKQGYEWLDDLTCIWVSLACLCVYIIILHPVNKGYMKSNAKLILMIVVCLELFISGLLDEIALDEDVVYSSRTSYQSYMEKLQPAVDYIHNYDDEHFNDLFYRMEKTSHRKTNDPMALDFYGISNSTSTLNTSVINMLNKLGYASKSHWTKYLGGSPVADSVLGIKYIIITEPDKNSLYEPIYNNDENQLYGYYNPFALSLAYGVSGDIYEIDGEDYKTPFEYTNALITAMLGHDEEIELFKNLRVEDLTYDNVEVTFTTGHKKYTPTNTGRPGQLIFNFTAEGDNNEVFCYFPSDYKREVALRLNGSDMGTFFGNETYRIVSLGLHAHGAEMNMVMTLNEENLYLASGVDYFYYLDRELFREILPLLQGGQLEIDSFKDTEITGKINVPAGMTTLFTSIPYDEGWRVYVDGVITETAASLDSLLSVDLTEGMHEIKLRYLPDCVTTGLMISAAGITAFIALILIDKKKNKKLKTSGQ
ncbi:MAG: YfhO family protein [Eubacteriales bacterium]|nr:YfhO family protein [Eubacteriales bacterium]